MPTYPPAAGAAHPDPEHPPKAGEAATDARPAIARRVLPLVAWIAATLLLLAAAYWVFRSARASDGVEQPVTTFVHATDPHLFLERKYTGGSGRVEPDSAQRKWQERLDREALRSMLSTIGNLPARERPEFILFTGDWGIDTTSGKTQGSAPAVTAPSEAPRGSVAPTGAAADTDVTQSSPAPPAEDTSAQDTSSSARPQAPAQDTGTAPATGTPPSPQSAGMAPDPRWVEQADSVAVLLNASPIRTIYWVPGNNDVAGESSRADSLALADEFNTLVAQRLRNGITLQNLTACYTGRGSCSADVPDTRYTLVGVPTVSFKKSPTAADTAAQEAILDRAASLAAAEAAGGRRVLLATHIPELDDPYTRGQQLYLGAPRPRPTLGASAWNVSDSTLAKWKRLVESPAVAYVLAGHFHDSHREVYERPYRWAESSPLRADPSKLLLAPPLSVKNQEASPYQARGFALVRIFEDGEVERQIYWLDPTTGAFVPQNRQERRTSASSIPRSGPGILRIFQPLWDLADGATPLARAAVIALALLFAFLTVAALWIPGPKATETPAEARPAVPAPSNVLFEGNLARTVWAGLTGIAAVTILANDYWQESRLSAPAFYVVWFTTLFLLLLVLNAVWTAVTEILRSRTATSRFVAPRAQGESSLRYWSQRAWAWLLSLRESALVAFDSFSNVLLGRASSANVVWEQRIVDSQQMILRASDRIREEITTALHVAILQALPQSIPALTVQQQVRVSISVLSDDHRSVFYISSSSGSLSRQFTQSSFAWVAAYTGIGRWWFDSFKGHAVTLFDNTAGTLPDTPAIALPAEEFVESREHADYRAFIVLPIPWRRRTLPAGTRRGLLHISFGKEEWMEALWTNLPRTPAVSPAGGLVDPYATWHTLLDPGNLQNEALRAVLFQGLNVLGELLRNFDQEIFESRLRRQRGS